MIKVSLNSEHLFRKENVVTLQDSISQYDIMKCSACGIKGKCRDLRTVEIDGRSKNKAENCNKNNNEVKASQINQEFEMAKQTDINCPKCDSLLRSTADWIEEGFTDITHKSVICLCGFKDLIEVK
jgi:DNA-directed RNA polymerase subunit M/transcription elongation factor TFIIS